MRPHALAFQDLEFSYGLISYRTGDGRLVKRVVPYGMPAIGPEFPKAVFYLVGVDPATGNSVPIGTGLIVSRPAQANRWQQHYYGVTAYHVAIDSVGIKINTKDGRSRIVDIDGSQWTFKPGWDDLAAIDLTDLITFETDDFNVIDQVTFLDQNFVRATLRQGEDGFMMGLFIPHPGEIRNSPAPRFGCLSILASDNDLIEQGNGVSRPSFVFEMHSRPGHSGSPVFVYRTPAHVLGRIDQGNGLPWSQPEIFVKLLGIHSGQFREPVGLRRAEAYGPQPIREGDQMLVPSSMTVVVPAFRIKELLELETFSAQRQIRESGRKPSSVIPEGVVVGTPASEAENPDHLEDFNRLLGAAVKEPKPSDQT